MERKEVTSSQIHAIGYDAATQKMEVEFKQSNPMRPRSVYEYSNVKPEEHAAFMAADSKGAHFGKTFKLDPVVWPYRKVEQEVQSDGPTAA